MSDSNNKENPSTVSNTKYETGVDHSPSAHKVALKPISPNKGPNSYVGKLNFLQGDNIDNHFNNIHHSHQQLHQQLHNLEAQTTQTGIDLGQLCDRLKNNNQYLTQLLENITNYSNEVITEGNATKNDISSITKRLDLFNDELKKLGDNLPTATDSIREIIRTEVPRDSASSHDELLGKIKDLMSQNVDGSAGENVGSLVKSVADTQTKHTEVHEKVLNELEQLKQRVPESDLAKQIVDPIVAELKSVSLDSDSQRLLGDIFNILNREKETNEATDAFQRHTLEKLEHISTLISKNDDEQVRFNELKRSIDDLHQDTQTQNNDILLQLSTRAVQTNELANINFYDKCQKSIRVKRLSNF